MIAVKAFGAPHAIKVYLWVSMLILFCSNVQYTCFGDRVSAGGECEAAVTVRSRCGWVKFMECGELLYGMRFPLC